MLSVKSVPAFVFAACLVFAAADPGAAAPTQLAQATPSSAITVEHAWARATAATAKTGAVYFTIVNKGVDNDRLVSASSPASAEAMLHQTIEDHGVMKMRPLPTIEVKPGASVTLIPGKIHLMLMGLKAPLKVGDSFPVTLTFEKAGPVDATVTVEKAGAGSMDHAMPRMQM